MGIHSRMDTMKRELVDRKITGGIQSEHSQVTEIKRYIGRKYRTSRKKRKILQ